MGSAQIFFQHEAHLIIYYYVSDRKTRLTIVYGAIMVQSSLGVLLCELRPDIDTLLCSIGLECVKKNVMNYCL